MPTRLGNELKPEEYQVVRSNWAWSDHILRTYATAAMVAWLKPETVCDPACGDASIVINANKLYPIEKAYLSDISSPSMELLKLQPLPFEREIATGPALANLHGVDLTILTEILEHLERPSDLLSEARKRSNGLIASSPIGETWAGNHEHVWGWSKDEYRQMLVSCGWEPIGYQEVGFSKTPYTFQIWACQ